VIKKKDWRNMLNVNYEDNGRRRSKHIYGPPELLIGLPQKPIALQDLLLEIERSVNEELSALEDFARACCGDDEVTAGVGAVSVLRTVPSH
jgi:hypothetical protein